MFTREELAADLPRLIATEASPIEHVEFGHEDFTSPCSEQSLDLFLGSKKNFVSGLHFWVKTLQAQNWAGREAYFRPYAEAGLCELLSRAEFSNLVAEYCGSLTKRLPPPLLDLDTFRSGMRMYADWNDIGAVAELNDAFVAFYWSTTA